MSWATALFKPKTMKAKPIARYCMFASSAV
jgi:hypothetical protein